MKRLLLIKYGEIALKGLNRNYFIASLVRNIKTALKQFRGVHLELVQSRIMVENVSDDIYEEVIDALRHVFGIVRISEAYETDADMDAIFEASRLAFADKKNVTYKVETNRADKSFPLKSPEVSAAVGSYLTMAYPDTLKVDVKNPQFILYVEIRQKAYVYHTEHPGEAGLPIPVSGKGAVLLSGGIDSPVASWLMSRRGMKMYGIHFHSYPFTSLDAQKKVEDLSRVLAEWNGGFDLFMVNIVAVQEAIIKRTKNPFLTVLLRRAMIHVANILAERHNLQALITGESLGQVASQTVESLTCTNEAAAIPILRPLIGNDKNEIVAIARRIGTFDISIKPFEDCCTIFVPKHPLTKPLLSSVLEQESLLDAEELILEVADQAVLMHF